MSVFNKNEYIDEVKEKWGNTEAYKEEVLKTKDYSKEKFDNLEIEMNNIFAEFASCMNDGNDVIVNVNTVNRLNKYNNIYSSLNGVKGTIDLDTSETTSLVFTPFEE